MKTIVMILTNEFNPDPRVYKEARYLISRGFRVTILCWDRQSERQYLAHERIDGINVIRYRIKSELGSGMKQLPEFLKYLACCRRYLSNHDCAYIHANDFDGALVAFAARKKRTPVIFDMHEVYEDVGVGHEIQRRIMRYSTIFFVLLSKAALFTDDMYRNKSYRIIQKKLYQLRNYPDSNLIQPKDKNPSDVLRIGYHGGLRSQVQEFQTLFEATKDLDNVKIDIFGDGPDFSSLRRIQKSYPKVTLHGAFDGARELTNLYANTDVEYCGYRPWANTKKYQEHVKYFECITTGTPMILTKAYERERAELEREGYGIACDTTSVSEVRNAVLTFLHDKNFWQACHDNEINNARKYDWNNVVRVLDRIYKP